MKYEAKFLLILHEEPGVNCVLPISSSRALQSLCFDPTAASGGDFSKSSFVPPCPKLEDSSQAHSIHGLLGLGVQGKGSSGNGQATCVVAFISMVMIFKWSCCQDHAVPAQPVPAKPQPCSLVVEQGFGVLPPSGVHVESEGA
ncbi:hypothetical protein BTVI_46098 [Pitangus sulphuratus]|nr:hypothetical protein BTVI_46098 [Pitangus sulphuratus]